MAEFSSETMKRCSHCPYKTASEEHMHNHILNRECPNGSFSYKEDK